MRPSPENTITMLSATRGGAMTSLDTRAVHCGLPLVSKASTSPLSVPTTTSDALAPGPADSERFALTFHSTRPLAASMRISVPSLAATYALAATIAGAKPGPPLPTACCHSTRGVTVAVSCGIGPGLWPPPVSQANDGTGGIQGDNGDCIRLAHPAQSSAPASVEASVRASRIISPL